MKNSALSIYTIPLSIILFILPFFIPVLRMHSANLGCRNSSGRLTVAGSIDADLLCLLLFHELIIYIVGIVFFVLIEISLIKGSIEKKQHFYLSLIGNLFLGSLTILITYLGLAGPVETLGNTDTYEFLLGYLILPIAFILSLYSIFELKTEISILKPIKRNS